MDDYDRILRLAEAYVLGVEPENMGELELNLKKEGIDASLLFDETREFLKNKLKMKLDL